MLDGGVFRGRRGYILAFLGRCPFAAALLEAVAIVRGQRVDVGDSDGRKYPEAAASRTGTGNSNIKLPTPVLPGQIVEHATTAVGSSVFGEQPCQVVQMRSTPSPCHGMATCRQHIARICCYRFRSEIQECFRGRETRFLRTYNPVNGRVENTLHS